LRVRAWVVAIGSCILCGDAEGRIKPQLALPHAIVHELLSPFKIASEFDTILVLNGSVSLRLS
jgi:hypothetical protein